MNAVLILAFRRSENIQLILDVLGKHSEFTFYVHVDKGRNLDSEKDAQDVIDELLNYRRQTTLDIRISRPAMNQGIAVSMIASINKVLESHEKLIIIEDDCVPGDDFMKFMLKSFEYMRENDSVALACGSQFAPRDLISGECVLTRYPLNWGWGINRTSWMTISEYLLSKDPLKYRRDSSLTRSEIVYWNAGSRRALEGFTDVWDTILVRELLRHSFRVLLPAENLVQNTGDEKFATHTSGTQLWTRFPVGTFGNSDFSPNFSASLDRWMRKRLFKISKRHLVTTRLTWLMDRVGFREKRANLAERVQSADINFDL